MVSHQVSITRIYFWPAVYNFQDMQFKVIKCTHSRSCYYPIRITHKISSLHGFHGEMRFYRFHHAVKPRYSNITLYPTINNTYILRPVLFYSIPTCLLHDNIYKYTLSPHLTFRLIVHRLI